MTFNEKKQLNPSYILLVLALLTVITIPIGITYKIGYYNGIKQVRTEDMNELITLRQVMQQYPSSIVVINCEQQKKIQHKLRQGFKTKKGTVSDSIYFTGVCK